MSEQQLSTVTTEQLGEQLGEFQNYNSQIVPAYIEGTRIVKCCYKHTKNMKEEDKRTNQYVRIPDHISEDTVVENIEVLMDHIIGFLQETEDEMIKADHKAYVSRVYTEYLNIDKIVAYLDEQETSGRLTKEKIAAWFETELKDKLTEAFKEKTQDEVKIAAIIKQYQAKFESLAGGRTFVNKSDCDSMLKAMEVAEVFDTALGKKFKKRLEGMEEKETDLLESL